jgi:hypothetical protein
MLALLRLLFVLNLSIVLCCLPSLRPLSLSVTEVTPIFYHPSSIFTMSANGASNWPQPLSAFNADLRVPPYLLLAHSASPLSVDQAAVAQLVADVRTQFEQALAAQADIRCAGVYTLPNVIKGSGIVFSCTSADIQAVIQKSGAGLLAFAAVVRVAVEVDEKVSKRGRITSISDSWHRCMSMQYALLTPLVILLLCVGSSSRIVSSSAVSIRST